MLCTKCGADVPEESRFCPKCGERLDIADVSADADTVRTSESALADTISPQDKFQPAASKSSATDAHIGEHIWSGKFSPKAMIGVWIALAALSVILLILAISLGSWWWQVFFYATPILWLGGYARLLYNQWSVNYKLTTKRFTHEHGLLRRVTDRIEVIDMDDVSVSQSLVERFTGTGTVKITSSDRSHPEFYIKGIDDAVKVAGDMDDARRAERERRGLHIESI
ncbi:MAG: PH domain-containing protein [Pirellulales bacterium]|nr:PH domain-containing protein [Pirellulales bacterium]